MENKIILASSSPRRKQLLEYAEIPFEIIVEPTDESFPENLTAKQTAIYIARRKALAVKKRLNDNRIILAADTIVVLNNLIIGKPKNKDEAIQILTQLQGTKHHVISGVSIIKGALEKYFAETTKVTFHPLSQEQIKFYVGKFNPFDKAGAYAIQEWIGIVGIKSINGDFYNVMGLPVSRVVQELAIM